MLTLLTTLAIIGIQEKNKSPLDRFLETYNLDGMNLKNVIQTLEATAAEAEGFNASITGSHLILSDQDESYEIELPAGEFYLSIAPYINQTHPCSNHNLVTCRGEMKSETFHVIITDLDTNEVVIDANYESTPQGFFGLWLEQNKNYQIVINYDGMTQTETLFTSKESNTCLTTMQLA
ncbi:MAG: hypothetical protein A2Y45_00835 [Tenericutes bacterium GWC2_34_14]|nr:MAG: hypothetical protein A2Z84_02530 [Tenericutes bacterium GWA2_35_7]OHE29538.1 MAG: hypothetical protein A2Y45_00835 [Tenericutes bacterium GWC2_34_14]OHE34635.1 MAG: hypothetical protein A2012_08455 [Tenericutes bacterium GWE2_34_108]OHE35991.1 MAG: hypothetical protein A2Y46_03160 [Tenericutes bacterium GWF1_35_14]OHE39199.1 MAG: hypothetical protein A2Y44_06770 [Tenericutes bacterium GWF2_35_184]OHE43011.1 MAG: hypothetical protein A2221_09465 [Tenericutes bacterium RIFOXYA2_FULL_36_3